MIPLPKQTKVLEKKENKGLFEIEALYPGYGVTIGNSLRRVLLSSLPGAAVIQVKIKGVPHEFSTLPGVLEDIVTILLNLKQMRFKLYGQEAQAATLKIRGEKEVRACDFKFPPQVELINRDLPIAHLTEKGAELDMEIVIGTGIGYETAKARKRAKEEIGTLSLDASYNPVQKVNFRVEQMRVGEKTDFDRVILDIETDGSMDPETALAKATDILLLQFQTARAGLEEKEAVLPEKKAVPRKKTAKKKSAKKKK